MKKLNSGSARLGNCEICNKWVDTMYISKLINHDYAFGHKKCIKKYEADNPKVPPPPDDIVYVTGVNENVNTISKPHPFNRHRQR